MYEICRSRSEIISFRKELIDRITEKKFDSCSLGIFNLIKVIYRCSGRNYRFRKSIRLVCWIGLEARTDSQIYILLSKQTTRICAKGT